MQGESIFECHPRRTIVGILGIVVIILLVITEVLLSHNMGLGKPVLFSEHPAAGYRPQPNQSLVRFYGARLKVNNLGLRTENDWNMSPKNKILFLGDSVTYGGNHISNNKLFSEIAVKNLTGFQSGNAGVSGWGVENVHGLVVETQFVPAEIYVTTFIEEDFYRGLSRGENVPALWFEPPKCALHELSSFLYETLFADLGITKTKNRNIVKREDVAERAVIKLKKMDEILKAKGFQHLIYISPTRKQVLEAGVIDSTVKGLLKEHGVKVIYLLEKIGIENCGTEEKLSWFLDRYHLTTKGHAVWGKLMGYDLAGILQPVSE